MEPSSPKPLAVAEKIRRNLDSEPTVGFRKNLFGDVARIVFPDKTDVHLAAIAGKSDRAARFWISGDVAAPPVVYAAILAELVKRPPE